jgi:hypothetical protein
MLDRTSCKHRVVAYCLAVKHGILPTSRLDLKHSYSTIYDIGFDSRGRIATRTSSGAIEYSKKDLDHRVVMNILSLLHPTEQDFVIERIVKAHDGGGPDGRKEVSLLLLKYLPVFYCY